MSEMTTQEVPAQLAATAILSDCRTYRYTLWRRWATTGAGYLLVVGLNPSTADETTDDPTIRRCVDYAKRWGFDTLCMVNLFAYRATDPAVMKAAADPIGPDNDRHLWKLSQHAGLILAAWGAHGGHWSRDAEVRQNLAHCDLHALGFTKDGAPRHPLYMRADCQPIPYRLP